MHIIFEWLSSPLALDEMIAYGGAGTNHGIAGSKQQDGEFITVKDEESQMRQTPTMVLETVVTTSETSPKLLSDVRYWFEQSGADFKSSLR